LKYPLCAKTRIAARKIASRLSVTTGRSELSERAERIVGIGCLLRATAYLSFSNYKLSYE